jgi:hypothetical protein
MRPHVAVRSPMSAVSLRATRATAHTDELARPWSRRSLLMFRFGGLADADASVAVWEPATQASRRSVGRRPRPRARNARPVPSDLKVQRCRAHLPPACPRAWRQVIDERASLSRRSPRAFRSGMLAGQRARGWGSTRITEPFTPACSLPPSVTLPAHCARSPMSGASLPATKTGEDS